MKLGYFMMPIHDHRRDYHTALMEDIEAIVHADELGVDEAWVGEHLTSRAEQITSPLLFLSNLIARTKRIKLATGVICLPQYHPALIAGYAALFDHMAEGRFIMGIGTGGLPPDMELFDVLDKDRGEMMLEAIDMIHKIWRSDPPFNIQGKYWQTKIEDWQIDELGLGHMAKPYQLPHPPVAISILSPYSGSARMAARRGWDPISANFIGAWSVASHWQVYAEESEKAGRTADPQIWRVARSIHVAETDAEAEAFVKTADGSYDYYYRYLLGILKRVGHTPAVVVNKDDDPEAVTHQQLRDGLVICGSPATVTEKLLALRDEVGDFGTLLMTAHDWTDKAALKNSMTLMAKEVMPAVNRAIGAAAAA